MVVALNLNEVDTRASFLELQKQAFGVFDEDLLQHIVFDSPAGFVAYGIYEANKLVACNGFVAHPVCRDGAVSMAYQSCMSATRKDQNGKGCFSRIINFAKMDLAQKGGAFIFGFPNKNSRPIFVDRLGFTISENLSVMCARSPIGLIGAIDGDCLSRELSSRGLVTFDARSTSLWKGTRYNKEIFKYEMLTNYLFGKVISRQKFGLNFKILAVGGLEINKPHLINSFFSNALRSSGCHALRIVCNSASALSKSSKFSRGRQTTEPTIAFGLNWAVDASQLELAGGVKDVF